MIAQFLGSHMRRALLAGRQDDSSALQLCLTNCLTNAVYDSLTTCNFDVACMCGQDSFRSSTLNCAKSNCTSAGVSESIIETSLTSVLDQCADGAFSVPTTTGDDDIKTTSTRRSSTGTSTPAAKDDSGPSTGLIAGAAVGGVVLVALFGILIWWLVKRSKRRAAVDNKPAFYPASGPVTPALDDSKFGPGQPVTQTNQPGGFVVGYNGQPYHQYNNTTASTNYTNSTATGPSAFGAPHAELGYVPPSQFDQFGAGAMGGGAASFAATTGTSGQQRPTSLYPAPASSSGGSSSGAQLLTTATPPSQSGSSGSRPGTSDAGIGGFNPYLQQQQQHAPLQLHQAHYDPYAAAGGTSADKYPADVKRPLNVMSADATPQSHQGQHQDGGELPPPMYTRQ